MATYVTREVEIEIDEILAQMSKAEKRDLLEELWGECGNEDWPNPSDLLTELHSRMLCGDFQGALRELEAWLMPRQWTIESMAALPRDPQTGRPVL